MSDQGNCAYRYTVKRGDSFYLIAQRQGVQLRDLLEANPDIPPARLMVGDVLCIPYCNTADTPAGGNESCPNGNTNPPCENPAPTPPAQETPYTCPANRRAVVQNGQTASDLQLRYNLSYHTLQTANSGVDLDALKGGDIVCVPAENIACPLPATVTVGQNDTLQSLSDRYGRTIADILRANPCLAPRDITPGTTIRLPE